MEIKVGQYYALESTEEGSTEINIIKILPNKPNMLDVFVCTETLYIKDGQVCDLYTNDWVKDSIQREATEDEIQLFKKTREKIGDLKSYGELVSSEYGGKNMKDFKGHRINKKQAEALQEVILTMDDLQEIVQEEDGYAADTVDSLIRDVEKFLYEIGAVEKLVIGLEEDAE
ncbi:hypothetical protein MOB37_18635 [Bacillus spizizenii]|nr:hypothetical protein [Bacillus spizizenii]